MSDAKAAPKMPIAALLCLGDASGAEAMVSLLPVYGQPLLHHVIKRLEACGVNHIYIGVDSVSPALLAYRDNTATAGLQIDFVRNPADIEDDVDQKSTMLLFRTDILVDKGLIEKALAENSPFVATVEERSENAAFERIDLNHRWAGFALLQRQMVRAITVLPEGWDMASALMRQAVQNNVRFLPLRQTDVEAGSLRYLKTLADVTQAKEFLLPAEAKGTRNLENVALSKPVTLLSRKLWATAWGRDAALWLFPALAAMALLGAVAQFPLMASITALFAILASQFRRTFRKMEYKADDQDREAGASWAAMAAALLVAMMSVETSLPEAGFVGLSLLGLLFAGARAGTRIVVASPLVIACSLILGSATDIAGELLRLIILAEIALIAIHHWRQPTNPLQMQ